MTTLRLTAAPEPGRWYAADEATARWLAGQGFWRSFRGPHGRIYVPSTTAGLLVAAADAQDLAVHFDRADDADGHPEAPQ